jgi:predicted metal-dependent phosphoesterase TrpH
MAMIDLHMHSLYSRDGEFTPGELIDIALKSGLRALSLTDHNTSAGVGEAMEAGKAAGLEVIPGIELDCFFEGVLFHVLGYGIDPDNSFLRDIAADVQVKSQAASLETLALIKKTGIDLDEEEVMAQANEGVLTGEFVAEVVLHKPGAEENPLLRPYLPGGSRSDNPYVNFYWDFCGQGKPAYAAIDFISMAEAIAVIEAAGGVPVLAHPGQMLRGREAMLPSIIAQGIRGIEAYSSYHTPEQNGYYRQEAEKLRVFITGGSDFHGKAKPPIKMGCFGFDGDGLDILEALREILRHQ